MDWSDTPLAKKRRGSTAVSTTGGTSFTLPLMSLHRHVPIGDETAAQFWAIDSAGLVKRNVAGVWANVTLDDAISGSYSQVSFCTFNGKLFMGYDSSVDRLHVFDPVLGVVRRVGLAITGNPTMTNTGGGAYAATLRYYRTRVIQLNGIIVVRRSEPSAAVAFTPSGGGTAARIAHGALPGERETHWEVEVSLDNLIWFVRFGAVSGNAVAVATATVDDSMVTTSYLNLDTAEGVGEFTLVPSARFLSTDGNRLLMAGSFESGLTSRIYRTPALGSSDHADDERIQMTNTIKGYDDLNEKDGGLITGITEAIDSILFAFKYRQTWRGNPTGDASRPYIWRKVSNIVGCVFFKTIVLAEDYEGNPTIGFLSPKGPYRVGVSGLLKMGRDVDDVWYGLNGQTGVNFSTNPLIFAHGIYHADLHQIWWFITRGTNNSPDLKIVVDIRQNIAGSQYGLRGGWAVHDGLSAQAACSVMFAETIGATMSLNLKPYIGYRDPA